MNVRMQSALCALLFLMPSGHVFASILQVSNSGSLNVYFAGSGLPVVPVSTSTFNSMSAATLGTYDAIFIDTDFSGSFSNPNLASVVGANRIAGDGRVFISTHDPAHNTPASQWLTRNAATWAAAPSIAGTNATGFVMFGSDPSTWASSLAASLPAFWGIGTASHSSDSVDILPAYQGTHPIYAGPHGTVTDFPAFTPSSVNWGNGHHQDFVSFNAALFATTEVDLSGSRAVSILSDPAPVSNGTVPEPFSVIVWGCMISAIVVIRPLRS